MITETEREYLLDSMMKLLDDYGYNYTLHALNLIIDEWAFKKSTLIEAFKRHPNYVDGKFLIAFDFDYTRDIDKDAISYFEDWLCRKCVRSMDDDLPDDIRQKRIEQDQPYITVELANVICSIHRLDSRNISKEFAEELEEALPQIHARAGQKTSRVINKLCTYLNYSKHPDYNKEFAKFADALSPLKITRHTVLSINPLDYLTMSFGNSWASCHTIDKDNRRNMPNAYHGQYSSGTISYMLDSSSMVFYTVDAEYNGTDYWTQPKINRQMFHYGEDKLVQGRLYPQDNDDDNKAYDPYRATVQSIMAIIFDFPNLWTLTRGVNAASKFIESEGTHYLDYCHYNNCTLSKIKDVENNNKFIVGARPICINCGVRHEEEDNIDHCYGKVKCEHCGAIIEENEAYEIDGHYYCGDCVSRCAKCDEYHLNDDLIRIDGYGTYVCGRCLENYYIKCAHCGKYKLKRYAKMCEKLNDYVCNSCYNEHYAEDEQEENVVGVQYQEYEPIKIKFNNIDVENLYSRWSTIFEQYFSIDEEDI